MSFSCPVDKFTCPVVNVVPKIKMKVHPYRGKKSKCFSISRIFNSIHPSPGGNIIANPISIIPEHSTNDKLSITNLQRNENLSNLFSNAFS